MANHEVPREDLRHRIGYLLRVAQQKAFSNVSSRISKYGITPIQFATLLILEEKAPRSQNHLGREIAMEPGNFHLVVKNLYNQDLIAKRKDAEDARRILLSLTPKGKRLVNKLDVLQKEGSAETLSRLSNTEAETLLDLLAKIA
jgi:DNA-binding MarR family transcriptional regulator